MPAKSSIGTSAVQLTATSTTVSSGVLIKASESNTGIVYVGFANTVTANSSDTTDGIPIHVGQSIIVPPSKMFNKNITDIWVIGSASGQKVFWETELSEVPSSGISIGIGSDNDTTDGGPSWTSVFGVSGARYTSADRSGSAASVTDAPTGGQKLVITDVIVSVDTAMRVDLKEETSGTVLTSIYLPASGTVQLTSRSKLKLATADKKLQVQTSAAGNIAVTAFYYSEA